MTLPPANPLVTQNAAAYSQAYGVLTLEIVKGCQQAQAAARMQRFLNAVAREEVFVFALDFDAAKLAGEIDRTGQTVGIADPIIAAIALENNLKLVTGNAAHFQRILSSVIRSRWPIGGIEPPRRFHSNRQPVGIGREGRE